MARNNRRSFLQLMGGSALATAFPESIKRALAVPAAKHKGTIDDIEHIVILMQENRSFDHYFGTLRGVRGFDDPHPVTLPSGKSVWHQPDGGGFVLPFRPKPPRGAHNLGNAFLQDVPHGWTDGHEAWNDGKYDQWVPEKGVAALTYMTRRDLPFHFALADAFTICDGYYCSLQGSTDPNRYHMFTGWCGNDGNGGGPVIDNSEAGYDWATYPEWLEGAGISWKVYQDIGEGLDAAGFWGWTGNPYIGNYGDNSLLYFHQYQNAAPGTPLARKAKTGTNITASGTLFDVLKQDVVNNKLPQVSWVVAPEAYSEHPNWIANYGAWYIARVLNALTANAEVWSKTVLFINYDEAGGFFDHMTPPYPPSSRQQGLSTASTTNEIFPGNSTYAAGPYGLGNRVPMFIVSPWSAGGYVCSQVFDHTSLIQFIEQRFGVIEPNITAWRRAVCGDLTSAFDFANPNFFPLNLPSTDDFPPSPSQIAAGTRLPDFVPTVPANQSLASQEPGTRYARALPYELEVSGHADLGGGNFRLEFANTGTAGACFQVRSAAIPGGPWTYTVEAGKSASETWPLQGDAKAYDLAVYGPNGFFRAFNGGFSGVPGDEVAVSCVINGRGRNLALTIANHGTQACSVNITDAYTGKSKGKSLAAGQSHVFGYPLRRTEHWYDLAVAVAGNATFARKFAGHAETGEDSTSDPAIGSAGSTLALSERG